MKKSIFLIAPLTFLMSCTTTSEIFDDAYDEAKQPAKVTVNDESGYADYIKNHEHIYTVQVDSNKHNNRGLGGNPTYYRDEHDHTHHQQHQFDYYGEAPLNNNGFNYGFNTGFNGYGMNFCHNQCMTWRNRGTCWHIAPYNNGIYGQSWNQYGGMNWGYPYDPYSPFQNYYGNAYYPNAFSHNSYYGNMGGWYNNNYYWSGYYQNGYYNNNNGYWGSPYYGGNNIGWVNGPSWSHAWMNNNNWNPNGSNNNQDWTSNGNHHYGHRNGTNTGSHSQNNTNYEHTVKGQAVGSTPFPVYAAAQDLTQPITVEKPKPVSGTSFNGVGTTVHEANTVTHSRGITAQNAIASTQSKGGSANGAMLSNQQTNALKVVKRGAPASNQFTAKHITTTSNGVSRNGPSNNTYTANYGTVSRNGSSSANRVGGNTYANPNKYGSRNNPTTTSSKNGTSYNSGTYNNTSRRDYNSPTNSSTTTRPYNASPNRSTNSSYQGSRSTNSGSTVTRSNSSGSSTKNSSSRRR